MRFGKKGALADSVINKVLALSILFVMAGAVLMTFFNTTYNTTVTGLSTSTTQGIWLIAFVIGVIAIVKGLLSKS